MINPDVAPPLPPGIVAETVYKLDQSEEQVVTIRDAARLAGVKITTVEKWIADGRVTICLTPDQQRRVLVSSLWMSFPIELRR